MCDDSLEVEGDNTVAEGLRDVLKHLQSAIARKVCLRLQYVVWREIENWADLLGC